MFCDAPQESTNIRDSCNSSCSLMPPAELSQESMSIHSGQNHQLELAKVSQTQQQPVAQPCASVPCVSSQTSVLCHHANRDPCRLDRQADRVGGNPTSALDCHAAQSPAVRAQSLHEGPAAHDLEEPHGRGQQSCQEKGHPDRLCSEDGSAGHRQHDHCPDLCPGRDRCDQGSASIALRKDELWAASRSDLPGGDGSVSQLCEMGHSDCGGEQRSWLAPGPLCDVGQGLPATSSATFRQQAWLHGPWETIKGPPYSRGLLRRLFQSGRERSPGRDRAAAPRVGSRDQGEVGTGTCSLAHQEPPRDLSDSEDSAEDLADHPEQHCLESHKFIGRQWKEDHNPFSASWSELVQAQRLFLLEVACSERSVLTQEACRQLGEHAAQRCSIWNGYDLTKPEGVRKIKQLISTLKPCHVWISCDCGPYSPLQRLNQRSEEQTAALEAKREYARAEYLGGIEVAKYARQHGSAIHWELSEKCETWHLPMVSEFVQQQGLQKVTCHGCTVNLRAADTGDLMCKGWTIATSHAGVHKHLNLPCQRNHKKAYCESGRPRMSAFYTPVFAKKVIEAMQYQEPWSLVSSDLQSSEVPAASDSPEPGLHSHEASVAVDDLPPAEVQRIQKLLRHIHSVSGHGSTQTLVRALQKRGVQDHVLELARRFQCPICQERKRVAPRRPATLETIPLKWQVVQSDMGSWYHPLTKDKCKFIIFIDEGSRFRTGKVLFENSRNQATWPLIQQCFEEHWLAHHGQPESIRVDPEGVWRGEEADAYCRERGISLTPIPAEAHWQVGIVENAIKAVKHVMTSLAEEFKDMTMQELFSRALWACNSRDNQCGYSPLQHATGRAPDEWGRLFESTQHHHPIHPQQMIDGGFAENIKAMSLAEQSFAQYQAEARLARATAAGSRPMKSFCPGDLVYYWRRQVPVGEGSRGGFSWSGQFVGPARVLAVETREDETGKLRPGSCVWLHRAGRLIRAAPEQLRPASEREVAIESLRGPVEIPWTITSLATHPTRKTYVDVSNDLPTHEEYVEASQHPTLNRRFTSKRKSALESQADREGQRSRTEGMDMNLTAEQPSSSCKEALIPGVEITIELPDSKRGIQRFIDNPEAFVVSQLRRKAVEVQERKLTRAEVEQFDQAKQKEIRSFLQSQCFKVVPDHMLPPRGDAIGMRWLLTWKSLQDGTDGKKAKARAIILGYQDKSYEHKQTASPTLSRVGRQAFLLFCARMHFRIQKGDVSAAFLQGDHLEEDMWVIPTKEICHALGVPEGTITKLQRAAYGLVEAPLWWYKSVSKFLESLGYVRLKSEPCVWVYFDKSGKPRSIISGHVDDFLFGGSPHDEVHLKLMAAIQAKFAWGQWENTPFVQCGVRVTQHEDFGFELEQSDFINSLKPIFLSRDRERMRDSSTTDSEKTQLRAVLGSLSWLCGQTDYMHSSDVGFLISSVPHSTVQDIVKTNQLIQEIKRSPVKLTIHGMPKEAPLDLVAWADAAWANRPDNSSSTGGIVIAAASPKLRRGELCAVNLLSWRSYKIDRASRSPACAETHAVVDGEDELFHVRYLWSEMHMPPAVISRMDVDQVVRHSPGILVTDSRNFYDKLSKDTPVIKGAERRADIEALSVKESMSTTGLMLRWVHSDAQLANSHTKPTEKHQVHLFQKLKSHWRIIFDPDMQSARRRKSAGLQPMEGS